MVFNLVIGGKASQSIEFSRVLHVPMLRNNLLACLFLTKYSEQQNRSSVGHFHKDCVVVLEILWLNL